MGKAPDPVTEADLHGFLDEEIGPERRAKVAEHLEQKPLDAALIDTWRTQNEMVRGAFTRIAREPIPLSLSLAGTSACSGGADQHTAAGSSTSRTSAKSGYRLCYRLSRRFDRGGNGCHHRAALAEPFSPGRQPFDHGRSARRNARGSNVPHLR